jgi:sugar phosphate isomerase/epimerase
MKLAAQMFTLREFMKTQEEVASTFKRVKEIGYNAVQVSGIKPGVIEDKALKEIADQNALTICVTHIPHDALLNNIDAVIEKHKIWECKYVGLGSMPKHYRETKEGYLAFTKEANEIAKKIDAAGLKFVYHNHNFEFVKFDGKTGMEILMENFDPNTVDIEFDVYWLQAGGADPAEWVRKVDGRMKVVHLKDMIIWPENEQRFAEVGEGNMNFDAIIKACREIGVEWAAVEQDQCYGKDPFECLETSFRNLRSMGVEA